MKMINRSQVDQAGAHTRFEADVRLGLSARQKSLPCQYFYDQTGSLLFELITELDEYYPTRTEIGILQTCVQQISAATDGGTVLIEFGSGSSVKTDILLAACPAITHYVPIDVSSTILAIAKERLQVKFPALHVQPVLDDFTADITLPAGHSNRPKLGFFPGSTIGNFSHDRAVTLMGGFRDLLGPGSRLIVGADLRKSPDVLVRAYDDAKGITAQFNLNLLTRINRELNGTFDVANFHHMATYDEVSGRVDMYLVSLSDQQVAVGGQTFQFARGERIHTEVSQKYDVAEFQTLAQRAGWSTCAVWTDPRQYFSVHEFIAPT
jgi:dimethylhistidine N-methyltransferase